MGMTAHVGRFRTHASAQAAQAGGACSDWPVQLKAQWIKSRET